MKPIEIFWMSSFGALIALPARPATVTDGGPTVAHAPTLAKSPYETLLEAQSLPGETLIALPADVMTNLLALQTVFMMIAVLIVLRWAPPAPVVFRKVRQAAAAAFARSRTRATIARNPFDL